MLSGTPPFNGADDNIVMDRVRVGKFSMENEEWSEVSVLCKAFVSKLLEKDPKKRYSAQEALKDEWFTT